MSPPPAVSEPWTTRRLLGWMTQTFEQRDLDSPRLCAEILLSHVVGCERLRLYMDPDRPASPAERDTLRDLVKRALAHVLHLDADRDAYAEVADSSLSPLSVRASSTSSTTRALWEAQGQP